MTPTLLYRPFSLMRFIYSQNTLQLEICIHIFEVRDLTYLSNLIIDIRVTINRSEINFVPIVLINLIFLGYYVL